MQLSSGLYFRRARYFSALVSPGLGSNQGRYGIDLTYPTANTLLPFRSDLLETIKIPRIRRPIPVPGQHVRTTGHWSSAIAGKDLEPALDSETEIILDRRAL